MKRKLMALCATVVVASVSLTLFSGNAVINNENDVSYAERPQYYNEAADMNTTHNEAADMNSTTANNPVDDYLDNKTDGLSNSAGLIGGLLGGGSDGDSGLGLGGGLGDAIGGIGDIFSGILGGGSDSGSQGTSSATYPVDNNNAGYIDPVPAVTYIQNQTTVNVPVETEAQPSVVVSQNETVNFGSTTNPYKKPAGEIKPGDSGEGVKWMQWMFIYTNYGLNGKSVTGVYDEETEAVVKKLQAEKGLTVDGIVNDAVIDKIELLYYEHSVTATTSASAAVITAPDTIGATGTVNSGEDSGSLGLVIIILAAAWCVAIIVIMIIFILKKKKKKQAKENSAEAAVSQTASETTDSPAKTNDMSLSDLFEDANK